jgi:PAS domain-containing protein
VDSNPAAREALRLGLSKLPKPLIGQLASALLRPWPAWREAYAARDAAHIEISLGAGAGERIYDAQITPLRARDGLFSGHLTLLRDVTARARAEARLARERSALSAHVRASAVPVILSRIRDRKLLYVNPQGAQLFGEPAEALYRARCGVLLR